MREQSHHAFRSLRSVAGMPNKRLAQSKLVRMVLNKGEALWPNWTKFGP